MHRLYRFTVFALVLAIGGMLAWKPLSGSGVGSMFWGYAAVGRWTWENQAIPRHTLYLWTAHEPWVYHHWLALLAFHGIAHWPIVMIAFTAIASLAPFIGALWIWTRRAPDSLWVTIPFFYILLGVAVRFEPRPELFSTLFLFGLMIFLEAWREGRLTSRWWLPAILVGFSLWANLHGAVLYGLIFLVVTAICDFLQDGWKPATKRTAALAALAPFAACVNPYGLDYWLAFRSVPSFMQVYVEWLPLYKVPQFPESSWIAIGLMTGLAVSAWCWSPRRRLAEFGWLILFGVMFVAQIRNIWPYAVVCVTVAALNAQGISTQAWWDRITQKRGHYPEVPFRGVMRVGIICFLVFQTYVVFSGWAYWQPLTPDNFDRGLIAFLRKHGHELHGHILNDQEVASYLEWRLGSECPELFIDRMDAFPDVVMSDWLKVVVAGVDAKPIIDSVDVVIFAVDRPTPRLDRPAELLDISPRWARVYCGSDAVIWVRRSKHEALIASCPNVNHVSFTTLVDSHPPNRDTREINQSAYYSPD